jgi:peptidoglycan-associated lipoprotein
VETSAEETSSDSASIEPGSQEDLIVNVGDRVFFNYDSAELDSDAQELLQDQVVWLKQFSDVSVIIEGHCDERGTREYNLALGEKRAQSVKNYLINLGISSDRVSTISYGKERPSVVGSNDGAWAQNRRSVTKVN